MPARRPSLFLRLLLLGVVMLGPASRAAEGPPALRLFAVTFTTGPAWDAAKSPAEQKFMREHSANLARLRAEGVAVLGGRYADKGLLLVRAADEAAVRAELARDPAVAAGTFLVAVDEYRPFQHGDTRPPPGTPEVGVVRAVAAAFNTHDADALAAHLATDVRLLSVTAEGQSVESDGREAVRAWLTGYFRSLPDVRSELLDLVQNGPQVSFRERTTWTARDGTRRSQTALAVYEVRDRLVVRAWYFPAHRDAPPPAK